MEWFPIIKKVSAEPTLARLDFPNFNNIKKRGIKYEQNGFHKTCDR